MWEILLSNWWGWYLLVGVIQAILYFSYLDNREHIASRLISSLFVVVLWPINLILEMFL